MNDVLLILPPSLATLVLGSLWPENAALEFRPGVALVRCSLHPAFPPQMALLVDREEVYRA